MRPLVLILTGVAFLITWIFDASVDAQGGAYATGVLVLFTSAAVAVTLAARRAGQRKRTVGFAVIAPCFVYTTVSNVIERPDGVKIGACFILAIVTVSIVSRVKRVFELRVDRDRLRRRQPGVPARLRAPHDPAGREQVATSGDARGVRRQDPTVAPRPRPARATPT